MYDRFLELLLEAKKRTKSQKAAARRKKNVAAQQAAAQQKKSSGDRTVATGGADDYRATAKPRPQTGNNQQKKPTQALVPYQGGETDQRALVPVPSTRAVVPVPSTRDVVPVGPEIQGQGNRKPIKPRDPGVEDAEFTVKPDRMPFNKGYRKFLKGAEAALSTRNRLRMPDTSIVKNAFSVASGSSTAPVEPEGRPTTQTRRDRKARGAAVRSVLGALTGRKSMHSSPPYKP